MKTLSIQQPWASLICSGVKDVENRTWTPPMSAIGEKLLIHASSRKISERVLESMPFEWCSAIDNAITYGWIPPVDEMVTGAIVGYVDLEGYAANTPSLWDGGDGTIKWILKNAYVFDEPIPAKGKLGVFDFPLEVLPAAHKAISIVPHREDDVLVLPYRDKYAETALVEKVLDLDLTSDNYEALVEIVDGKYIPHPTKAIKLFTEKRVVEFPVSSIEVYIDSYCDTNEPIFYTSLDGQDFAKFKIAYYSELESECDKWLK